jgi:hypothetical protein
MTACLKKEFMVENWKFGWMPMATNYVEVVHPDLR